MKHKLIKDTYLKHVLDYNIKFVIDNEDVFVTIKEIKKVEKEFFASSNLCLIYNGSYILELIPKNENYLIRAFFDKNKNLLEYYIDIIYSSGLDEESHLPYYNDLYTDLVVTNDVIEIWDEDELVQALKDGVITESEFELAQTTTKKLIKEIRTNKNKYLNMDLKSML
jgi:hypothetical protein